MITVVGGYSTPLGIGKSVTVAGCHSKRSIFRQRLSKKAEQGRGEMREQEEREQGASIDDVRKIFGFLDQKVCPRLCDLATAQQAESRNLGHTFLANSVWLSLTCQLNNDN